jgi:hypothetical protein
MKPMSSDLVCLSHLRWGFVFQRPQHLMSRFARNRRVFFVEEPVFEDGRQHLRSTTCPETGVHVMTPVLPHGMDRNSILAAQRQMLETMLTEQGIRDFVLWYYTPMAREFASWLKPEAIVYDCMDELSAFAGASPALRQNELALFEEADLVFTGGATLYESKKKQHHSVHLFPSSVDVAHFQRARTLADEPPDQRSIPHPRLGYAGVIDERMDLELLREAAQAKPDWHFVFLGPVVKIDERSLPQAPNIHYLGMKSYADLPAYFSGWQIGLLPFALNESTRFISPTKTPEYLAAGLHVISTPIRDVVAPYGDMGLVGIANGTSEFLSLAESVVNSPKYDARLAVIDQFLSQSSWDKTWSAMNLLIENVSRKPASDVMRDAGSVTKGAAHV